MALAGVAGVGCGALEPFVGELLGQGLLLAGEFAGVDAHGAGSQEPVAVERHARLDAVADRAVAPQRSDSSG